MGYIVANNESTDLILGRGGIKRVDSLRYLGMKVTFWECCKNEIIQCIEQSRLKGR